MAEEEKTDRHFESEIDMGGEIKMQTEKRRQAKLTNKALLETISNLERERKAKFNKLSKLKEPILVLMRDKEHVNEVKSEFNRYMALSDETYRVHKFLLGLLPDDEVVKHDI